jgi:maltodextrin utilization protein YvdJ
VCGVVPIFDENDWKLVKTFQRVKEALRIVLCCIGLPKIALVAD